MQLQALANQGIMGDGFANRIERDMRMSVVHMTATTNREEGVARSMDAFGCIHFQNKSVLIKPNFNTADPDPGSTQNDTLVAMVDKLWEMGAKYISVGERSFPRTRKVMEDKGIIGNPWQYTRKS